MKESVVIRLQRHDQIVSIDELCIEKEWADKLRQAVSEQQGLIIADRSDRMWKNNHYLLFNSSLRQSS